MELQFREPEEIDNGNNSSQGIELETRYEYLEVSSLNDEEKLAEYNALLLLECIDDASTKVKELCVYKIVKILVSLRQFEQVLTLLKSNAIFFGAIPKAKAAKIVRNILTIVGEAADSLDVQIQLCVDVIDWCKAEKRTFLRQRIEGKLASLYLLQRQPAIALSLVDQLLKELRKLDDKQMLTEIHLVEARIYHSLQNIPKAKASLTASRTAANAIYITPSLQAEIDEMSGVVHCEEGDFNTAYSYFLEAFDAYEQAHQKSYATKCLRYMILCKVLNGDASEVSGLISRFALNHAGEELKSMESIAKAANTHSLEGFESAIACFSDSLRSDDLISHKLDILYDNMLESNLLKIIHPFSCVEISHVANLVKLDEIKVVHKLSQMILDHRFYGILEQGRGQLIIYDSSIEDRCYSKGADIVANIGSVVDALHSRTTNFNKLVV